VITLSAESIHATAAGPSRSYQRRRILAYGITLFALALLQTTLLPHFPLLGITPDLCLLFVLCVAMQDGREVGGTVGLCAGFLECALGITGPSALPILFFTVGYGVGHLSGRTLPRSFPSYLILSASLCFLRPAVTLAAIGLAAQASAFDLTVILRGTLAPEMLVNFLFSLPMYPLMRRLCDRVQKKA
jgi:rod shape-determining protein MreD